MRTGSRTGVRWQRVDEDPANGPHAAAGELLRWVDEYLMRPHPELGRDGPVCPFVRHSRACRLFWAGAAPGGNALTANAIAEVVDDAFDVYLRLRNEQSTDAPGLTLVTMFPGLTDYDLIDAAHRARKTQVVGHGLMLGQFYPGCPVPGLWNRAFRPLDAPVPMLVLRKMMSTDFPFLAARTDWLYAYFTAVAPNLPRALRWAMAERMRVDGPASGDITALRAHSTGEQAR